MIECQARRNTRGTELVLPPGYDAGSPRGSSHQTPSYFVAVSVVRTQPLIRLFTHSANAYATTVRCSALSGGRRERKGEPEGSYPERTDSVSKAMGVRATSKHF